MRRRGAGALGRWGLFTISALGVTSSLHCQTQDSIRIESAAPQRPSAAAPALVRYGKWVALGGAFALGYQANQLHQDANDSYQALRDRCFEVPSACILTPGGRYADPVSERLFADTHDNDRRAARYLIAAEVSFAAAAAGFIWELLQREDRTPNIPFEPRVDAGMTSTRIGITVRF